MKVLGPFLIISLVLASPAALDAQSVLTFPRVLTAAEMPLTGYAVVNPTPEAANVLFSLYSTSGNSAGNFSVSVRPGGQISRLASELFPRATAGWVQVTSDTNGLRGFWLGGDFVNFADGAEAASGVNEFVFPLVSGNAEIDIVNPTAESGAVLIRLIGADGRETSDPEVAFLLPHGSYRSKSAGAFQLTDLSRATHAKVTCLVPCAGTLLLGDYLVSPSLAVVNGVSTTSAGTTLNFAHVVQGPLDGLNYSTTLSLASLKGTAQSVLITFTPSDGTPAITVQRDIEKNGALNDTVKAIFNLPDTFQSGWIKVVAAAPIAGSVVYAEAVQRGSAVTPGLAQASSSMVLAHIADLGIWQTGLAMLNPGDVEASIELFAIAPDGGLIGQIVQPIILPPGTNVAKLLREWIPQTAQRTTDGGFVFLRSTVPIVAIELFFTRDLKVLSNVPAFGLPPTQSFTPPRPN